MTPDSLTLRDRNLAHLLEEEIQDQRHVREQSIGEPEEGLRVHYHLFEKLMVRIPFFEGNCYQPSQVFRTKFFDALSLSSISSPDDSERAKLTAARQYLVEDLLLL
jgi:hypothetical protein